MAESLALVPVFTGALNAQSVQLCDARTLHAFMAVLRVFSSWIKGRIRKYGFVEGVDFIVVKNLSSPDLVSADLSSPIRASSKSRTQTLIDYHLTLDMAKELAMVENNEKGRSARRYFIACEKRSTRPMLVSLPYAVAPNQTLSAEQADTLRAMLTDSAASMPLDLQGLLIRQGWSKLKSHFKVGYREIPQAQFTEAVSLLARHIAHWNQAKVTPALPEPMAASTTTLQLMLITTRNGQPTVEILPASELPQLILGRDSPLTTAEVLEVANHANLRMTNEVGRLIRNSDAARMKKAVLALDTADLSDITQQAWLELAMRTTERKTS